MTLDTSRRPQRSPDLQRIRQQLAVTVAENAARLGLRLNPQPFLGEHMVLPDGRELRLDTTTRWRDVELQDDAVLDEHSVIAVATAMLKRIAQKHGPGMVWSLAGLPLVHLVEDDGEVLVLGRQVRLRTLHAHEATATTPARPGSFAALRERAKDIAAAVVTPATLIEQIIAAVQIGAISRDVGREMLDCQAFIVTTPVSQITAAQRIWREELRAKASAAAAADRARRPSVVMELDDP